MFGWNHDLFLALNGPARPARAVVVMADALANSPVILVPSVLVLLWVRSWPDRRAPVLATFVGVLVARGWLMSWASSGMSLGRS